MEPITHFLTGAVLARSGFNRKTALATVVMTLGAEAADVDMVAFFRGSVSGFAHHRGITHTFVGVPFVAALTLGIVWLFYKWRRSRGWEPKLPVRWGLLYLFACIAGLVHILLDFTNQYGVRPFEPFSYQWYSWDIVAIWEPVLWVILLAGLLLPTLFSLINEEIGAKTRGPKGRVGAIVALIFVCLLWWFRDLQHRRAVAALESQTYLGAEPIRVSAYPYDTDPFTWMGVVETQGFFATMHVESLSGEVDRERRMYVRYKPEETPVTLAAKSSKMGKIYLDWAAYPYVETQKLQPPDSGYLVRIYDLRYAYPERAPGSEVLGAKVRLDDNLKVTAEGMGKRLQPPD